MPRSMMSAPAARGGALISVDLLENVGRQTLDAVEIGHFEQVLGFRRAGW